MIAQATAFDWVTLANQIVVFVLAMFVGGTGLKFSALAGFSVGLCWVATTLGFGNGLSFS